MITTLPQSIVSGIIMLIYGQVAVYRTLRFTVKTTTDYLLDNPIHKQEAAYDTDMKSIGRYVNASLSRRTERTTWMIRSGVEVSTRRDDVLNGSLVYMGYTVPLLFTNNVLEMIRL